MKVLISLPALNEGRTVGDVIRGLPADLEGVDRIEVLVVDDGSTDDTAAVAREAGADVVSHGRHRGLGQAFHTAQRVALERGVDVMVTIDADGQFDPAAIPEMLARIRRDGAAFVTGTRFRSGPRPKGMPRVKYWGNRFFVGLLNGLLRERFTDVSCGFRAYSREALLNLNLLGKFTYTQEAIFDLALKGLPIAEVPIEVRYFADRKSRVAGSLFKYGWNALLILTRTARDFKPLRFFGILGAGIFLLGLVLNVWLLWHFLRSGSFSPYKFVGFTGTALNVVGILVLGFALLADMLDRLRINQERLLYYERRLLFEGSGTERKRSAP